MEIKIESGIPIVKRNDRPGYTQTLRSMKAGQSFVINANKQVSIGGLARAAGITIATRSIGDGKVRVWKIA